MEEPKYYTSWKGKICTAIVRDNARTWSDLQSITEFNPKTLNQVLSEMLGSDLLTKEGDNYKLEYKLLASCSFLHRINFQMIFHFQTCIPQNSKIWRDL